VVYSSKIKFARIKLPRGMDLPGLGVEPVAALLNEPVAVYG
jgi:hypothetical protein